MKEHAYSRITQNVLKIYGTARAALIIWLSLAFIFALGKMLYEDTSGLSNFEGYWPITLDKATSKIYLLTITVFQIVSKSLPTFFMLLYTMVSIKTSKILALSSVKPVLIFWFIQAFNFVFVLPNKTGIFSSGFFQMPSDSAWISVIIMLLTASPFIVLRYRKRGQAKTESAKDGNEYYNLATGNLYKIPHELYVAVASAIIALLFDMNLASPNLTISNGILFGLFLAFLILPKEELQRLLLFFIAPDTYHYAYQEMLATQQLEENQVRAEMVNRKAEIDLQESINQAEAAKNESMNKIRQLLSTAGKIYIETKHGVYEERINSLNEKLEKGDIDLATYELQMQEIFEELQVTYKDIKERKLELLPKPEVHEAEFTDETKPKP
jgi:hypothetical protein